MQLVVVVSSFNLALTFNGHIFSLLIVYFSIITLNKGNVGTNHLNNRILFVCNRKVIYYYYITLPSITITITITFGNFESITITGKSGYYILQLHITITPSLMSISSAFLGLNRHTTTRRNSEEMSNVLFKEEM